MEAGHKKNVIFGNYCMCVTNGREVRGLGVGGKGRWKKNVENVDVVSIVMERKTR